MLKLSSNGIRNKEKWEKNGFNLPKFDRKAGLGNLNYQYTSKFVV